MTKKKESGAAESGHYVGEDVQVEYDGVKMDGQIVAIVPPGEKVWGGTTLGTFSHKLGLDISEYNPSILDQVFTRNQTFEEPMFLVAEHYGNTRDRRKITMVNAEGLGTTQAA